MMRVLLANPRGFCAGVDRAIEIVERALQSFGAPVYVRHEVVHNSFVVRRLRQAGAVFVDQLCDVPDGAIVIFSAHGVSRAVRAEARRRGLQVLDATCPLVTKVHVEVARNRREGLECVLIGHAGHPEVEGTMGQAADGMHLVETAADARALTVTDPQKLAFVTQTTLSVSDTAKIIAALQERHHREHLTYAATLTALGAAAQSPAGHYTLSIAPGANAAAYQAVATATGLQATDGACRKFTLAANGARTAADQDNKDATAECWR